jgi:hypothetical protein
VQCSPWSFAVLLSEVLEYLCSNIINIMSHDTVLKIYSLHGRDMCEDVQLLTQTREDIELA